MITKTKTRSKLESIDLVLRNVSKINSKKLAKLEAMGKIDANGKTREDREFDKMNRDTNSVINKSNRSDKKANKNNLNTLKMSSHKFGRGKVNTSYVEVTDSIDAGTTKVIRKIVRGEPGIVGFRELDYLKSYDEIDMIQLSKVDYTTQLMYGLPSDMKRKTKASISGTKVFLDPYTFVKLVKYQREHNDTELVVSFERKSLTTRLNTGVLKVIVMNPHNPDHDYPGQAKDSDNSWRRREARMGKIGSDRI